jgi:hypothetical protein
MFENFVVSGIPLILVVFGLVEACKRFGLTGNVLTIISLVIGVGLAIAYQIGSLGLPVGFMGWFTVVIVGIVFGLTASGVYDFVDARTARQ